MIAAFVCVSFSESTNERFKIERVIVLIMGDYFFEEIYLRKVKPNRVLSCLIHIRRKKKG